MKVPELPDKYKDLIPPDSKKAIHLDHAFSWDNIFPGRKFWYACYRATTDSNLPEIPDKQEDQFHIEGGRGGNYKAFYIIDGITRYITFRRQSMANCGMTLFRDFKFPTNEPPEQFKDDILKFYRKGCMGYPFALATHHTKYKEWFIGWEQIDEFLNPNSDHYVQIWKFDRKSHQ